MASDPKNLRGVILNSRDFRDKDKIISFLSADSGVIDICVKGSKMAAITIPFVVADIVITSTGDFYYLKDYTIIESNTNIMKSLEAMTVAGHITNLISKSYIDGSNSRQFYELLIYSLYYLSTHLDKYLLVYCAFNWRMLNLLGYVIEYSICNDCHSEITSEHYFLSITTGEIYCSTCYIKFKSQSLNYCLIDTNGVKALNHFANSDYKHLFAISLTNESIKSLVDFTTKYLSQQLEGEYKALENLQSMLDLFKL